MKKKRIRLLNGHVLQVPLPGGLGYGYAKYIDLTKVSDEVRLRDSIRIFDYRSATELESLYALDGKPYLFQPLLVAGLGPVLREGLWKIVGRLPMEGPDFNIPHYKTFDTVTEFNATKWFYIENCDINTKRPTSRGALRHLEAYGLLSTDLIELRLAITFLKREGKGVGDYLDLGNSTVAWEYTCSSLHYTLDQIPERLWGKANLEGIKW